MSKKYISDNDKVTFEAEMLHSNSELEVSNLHYLTDLREELMKVSKNAVNSIHPNTNAFPYLRELLQRYSEAIQPSLAKIDIMQIFILAKEIQHVLDSQEEGDDFPEMNLMVRMHCENLLGFNRSFIMNTKTGSQLLDDEISFHQKNYESEAVAAIKEIIEIGVESSIIDEEVLTILSDIYPDEGSSKKASSLIAKRLANYRRNLTTSIDALPLSLSAGLLSVSHFQTVSGYALGFFIPIALYIFWKFLNARNELKIQSKLLDILDD